MNYDLTNMKKLLFIFVPFFIMFINMKYRIILLFVVIFITACGAQRKISRQYNNKSVADIKETFGEPKTVIESANGHIFIYEIEKELESTVVSQGKLTLDPIITPKATKITRYYFTVKNDTVISSKFEEEYKRQPLNK